MVLALIVVSTIQPAAASSTKPTAPLKITQTVKPYYATGLVSAAVGGAAGGAVSGAIAASAGVPAALAGAGAGAAVGAAAGAVSYVASTAVTSAWKAVSGLFSVKAYGSYLTDSVFDH